MDPLISTLAARAATLYGDELAVSVVGGPTLSFREVEMRASRFAGGLRGLGMRRGDRALLHLPNGWQWIVAYHAIARLGGVVVPANILLSADEVAYMASDSGARFVILSEDKCALVNEALHRLTTELCCITTSARPDFKHVSFDSLLDGESAKPEEIAPDDLLSIGYTSGTTGKPKGAMLTHRNVFMSAALTATIHVRQRGEATITALPLPHVYGNIVMNAAILVGMRLVILERFDAGVVLRAIQSERAAIFEGVPTMFYYMLAHEALAHTDLSSLRCCTVGGQTIPKAKVDAVVESFGCPLLELWGMTEVAGPAASHSPYWPPRPGSIGLPFPSMEMKVVDLEEQQRELPPNEPGELLVRGALVSRGYWANEEATRGSFTRDGWFLTGDVAYKDDHGYFHIVDRKKDLIITAGYNIYPAEVEQAIATHAAVAMVAVAGIADEEKGELAQAFIVVREGFSVTAQEIVQHCRTLLAAYKVPKAVRFLSDLPKNSTGKVLRRELRVLAGGDAKLN